jgi:hypothetical protein
MGGSVRQHTVDMKGRGEPAPWPPAAAGLAVVGESGEAVARPCGGAAGLGAGYYRRTASAREASSMPMSSTSVMALQASITASSGTLAGLRGDEDREHRDGEGADEQEQLDAGHRRRRPAP